MRALVISGGGSKGAFAGGIAEFLITQCGFSYDILVGTSTGSLIVPLLAVNRIDKLKQLYTTVTPKDIFSSNPFLVTKKNGEFRTRINHLAILWMFLKGAKTFGESKNLRKLISKMFVEKEFEEIRNNGKDVIVTVSNLTLNRVEYKLPGDSTYEDFCDWIWASANMVPFMSLLEKNGYEYADGGMGNMVPIAEAIRRGGSIIDVIVLKTEKPHGPKPKIKNALELTTRVYDFMFNQIVTDDITIGKLTGQNREVTINFYHPPEMLTKNSLVFSPKLMSQWWDEGFEYARKNNPVCKCVVV